MLLLEVIEGALSWLEFWLIGHKLVIYLLKTFLLNLRSVRIFLLSLKQVLVAIHHYFR
jgi:hypothetical protein